MTESARRIENPLVSALLLATIAFAVYALALSNGFAYDDVVIVSGDQRITQLQWSALFTKPYWSNPGYALYRPLVTFSFALDWAVSHGQPAWFHAVNALWHGAATLALFALLRAWFTTWPSLAGALLFAVHPVHVEAVANIVGRAELMAGTFFLAACALWAHEWPRARGARLAAVALLYALAMLCKESAATLPAILLLIEAARNQWSLKTTVAQLRLREYGTLAVVLAGLLVLRTLIAGSAVPSQLDPIMEVTDAAPDRIRSALQIWPHVLRLMVFPVELLADYGPRVLMPADGWSPLVLLGLMLFVSATLGGLLLWERGRPLGALLLLWIPITMLPVSNLLFPIGVLLAERTLYVPSVAVCFALALLLEPSRQWARTPLRAVVAGSLLLLVLAGWRTQVRIPDWDSTDTIMMAQLRDRPDAFRAEWHAARMARRAGELDVAVQRYQNAMMLWPYRERLVAEAAGYLSDRRDVEAALRVARYGAQKWPRNLLLQRVLAANALDAGDTITARRALADGLRIDPRDALLVRMSAALNPGKAGHE